MKHMNIVSVVCGAVLFLSPFIFGYSGNTTALWTSLVLGAIIALLGYLKSYKWAAIAGLAAFISPWILGFSEIGAALWVSLIVGAVVALGAGYLGFFTEKGDEGRSAAA